MEPINEAGALLLWHQELSRGERTTTTFDDLWEAACYEARARDEVREDQIGAANEDRLRAAGILVQRFAEKENVAA